MVASNPTVGAGAQSPLAVTRYPARSAAGQAGVEAQTLVLLHGWGCDSRTWQPLLEGLTEHFSVLTIDLPGFGSHVVGENGTGECEAAEKGAAASELRNGDAQAYDLPSLLRAILARTPERAVYLGWSLGGMLATALALEYPQRVSHLITLAANLSFVERADWPWAMPAATFEAFYQGVEASPAQALKRFCGLEAQGDVAERSLLKQLRRQNQDYFDSFDERWLSALGLLAELDNSAQLQRLEVPQLHLFGGADALVPVAAAEQLRSRLPEVTVQIAADAGHALHQSQPEWVLAKIKSFLPSSPVPRAGWDNASAQGLISRLSSAEGRSDARSNVSAHTLPGGRQINKQKQPQIDKQKVAQSFSRAAPTYDSVAQLQRDVADFLFKMIDPQPGLEQAGQTIVDLGSGTGYGAAKLAHKFPRGQLLGVDIAEGMLHFARAERKIEAHWLCGDAENLPLASNSVGLIFSSLALQWCEDLPRLLRELYRVLKPGGQLLLSTLGPRTLSELKQAWQQVDGYRHVNRFISSQALREQLIQARFAEDIWLSEDRVLQYSQLQELTHELKALGAHNINAGQSSGLTGRRQVQQFKAAYETFRQDGLLPATYEVYYARLFKGGLE